MPQNAHSLSQRQYFNQACVREELSPENATLQKFVVGRNFFKKSHFGVRI